MLEMNGEDITESVQIKGSVDVNTPGIYNLVYAAYNEDGFAKTFTRTVYVADDTASPLKSWNLYYSRRKQAYRPFCGSFQWI